MRVVAYALLFSIANLWALDPFGGTTDGQSPPRTAPSKWNAGRISLNTELEFGSRFDDEKVSVELEVSNVGTESLTIHRIETGCGCAVVQKPNSPIKPGAKVVIPIRLSLSGLRGPFSRSGTIHSSDSTMPTSRFRIIGDVSARISVEPQRLIARASETGGVAEARALVRRLDGGTLDALSIDVPASHIQAFLRETSAADTVELIVRVKSVVSASQTGIVLRSGREIQKLVPLSVVPFQEVDAVPSRLALGLVSPGTRARIKLRSLIGRPWHVSNVTTDSEEVSASLVTPREIEVRFLGAAPLGPMACTVHVHLVGASPSLILVPLTAYMDDQ